MNALPKRLLSILMVPLLTLVSHQAARAHYDPGLQRWINRNPIEEEGRINLYSFCANSSINLYDPDGCPPTGGDYPVPSPPGSGLPGYTPPGSSGGALGSGNLPPAFPILPPGFTCSGTKGGAPVITGPVVPPAKPAPTTPVPTKPGPTNTPTGAPPANAQPRGPTNGSPPGYTPVT